MRLTSQHVKTKTISEFSGYSSETLLKAVFSALYIVYISAFKQKKTQAFAFFVRKNPSLHSASLAEIYVIRRSSEIQPANSTVSQVLNVLRQYV